MSNNGESPRLDRIERIVEVIANMQRDMLQEHPLLLRAQVSQTDEILQLKKENELLRKQTDLKFQAVADAQQRMDDALTALMGTVDEIIRNPKTDG